MLSSETKETVQKIPLLSMKAGPRDGENFKIRLKEELNALIQINKESDSDWFQIACDKEGINWSGKCWYYHNRVKYEFKLQFEIPATYPVSPPEIQLPELEGKTVKMYRGGKICCDIHFNPLWAKNVPKFGIAHALALGLGPWLAVEIPHLVEFGLITIPEP